MTGSGATGAASAGETHPPLSEQELRGIFRLLVEAMAPNDSRGAKVTRLCDGLSVLIDADAWTWIRTRIPKDLGPPANIDLVTGGAFGKDQLAEHADWSLEVYGEPPENGEIKRRLLLGAPFTLSRTQLVPDEIWRTGRCLAHVERMGLDAFLYSFVPLVEDDGGVVFSGAMMFRRPGKADFDRRMCRIVHLVLAECGPLHREGLNIKRGEEIAELSPRLHSVLLLLIDGQSVPEIAERLCLSRHTVNDYVKAIYRHFKVNSRAELLRHFMGGGNSH